MPNKIIILSYLFLLTLFALVFRTTFAVTAIHNNTSYQVKFHQIIRRQTSNEYACGVPTIYSNALVVNGQNVTHGEHPWVVALFVRRTIGIKFQCAATLLSRRHVVTAAHCVSNKSPKKFLLKLGIHNIHDWGEEYIKISTVKRIQFHPEYNSYQVLQRDIAILVLSDPVDYTPYIIPACLWEGNDDLTEVVGQRGTVIGWGRDENGWFTSEPRKYTIPIVSTETCRGSRVDFHYFTNNMTLCAGDRQGSGPCNGDSGGGLFMRKGRRWVIRGLVSNSLKAPNNEFCDLSEYVIFTDVAKYVPWIKEVIKYCDTICDINNCELPETPKAGRYNILGSVSSSSGIIVREYTILLYSCDDEFTPTGTSSICIKGAWRHTVECLRKFDDNNKTDVLPPSTSTTTETTTIINIRDCTLPEYPKNGRYTVNGNSYEELIRSTVPEYTSLSFACDNGYQLSSNDSNVICLPGGWTGLPSCLQIPIPPTEGYCTIPVSDTENFLCRKDNKLMSCGDKVPVNTIVEYRCKRLHLFSGKDENLLCLNSGVFDKPIPRCKAECGVETNPFLIMGTSVAPWHVALYMDTFDGLQHYCGGTLISNKLFLTAAHCVYNLTANEVFSPSQLRAVVGMTYRHWTDRDKKLSPYAQHLQVKSIHVPPSWIDVTKQIKRNDIAIVEVETPIEIYEAVRPVCIDLSNDRFNTIKEQIFTIGFDVYSLLNGNRSNDMGKIAGWNLYSDPLRPFGMLQTLDMPVVHNVVCKAEFEKYKFGQYVTPDTFCAGRLNQTLSYGTFGGGLVFNINVDGKERWHILGIASTMPSFPHLAYTYVIFTDIYLVKDFLIQKLNELNFVW